MKFPVFKHTIAIFTLTLPMLSSVATAQNPASCYSALLSSRPPTLHTWIASINNGTIEVYAGDSMSGSAPPQWVWGDGTTTSAWAPVQHTYSNTTQNYVVSVSIVDKDNTTQNFSFPVFFVAPVLMEQTFPGISFQIPSQPVTLQTHWPYSLPGDITPFPDSSFPMYSRSDVAYILAAISSVNYSLVNENSFLVNGSFSMDMFEVTGFGGGESFWYTTPMSVGYGPTLVNPSPGWPLLFNEIGKDTALNTPISLSFGGNTDGSASEIYSETMGDIFSYASGCQLISNAASYGIGADVVMDLQDSMLSGAMALQQAYNTYVANGAPFSSWNPYNGGADPTLGTISTLAWKFIEHAEMQRQGYQIPLTRMMKLLQMFNPSMLAAYAPQSNTPAGATFRSTLMITALSYAFNEDLRGEFEALNFPIDDATYEALFQLASGSPVTPAVGVTPTSSSMTTTQALGVTVSVSGSTPWLPTPTGSVKLTSGSYTSAATTLSGGSATINVPAGSLATGSDTISATYTPDSASSAIYAGASGTASSTVTVVTATPTVTVTLSASSITTAQPLTVTVAVNGGSGNPTPTGTVNLTSGTYTSVATALSGGGAAINVPSGSLVVGTDTLTAAYSGDPSYSSSTGSATISVTTGVNPTFTVIGTPVTIAPGVTTANTSTITVTPAGGFTGSVSLTGSVTSSPTGAQYPPTLSFGSTTPVSISGTAAATAILTISTTAGSSPQCTSVNDLQRGIPWYAGGSAVLACVLLFGIRARRRSWQTMLGMLALLVTFSASVASCGGGGGSSCPNVITAGTTAGTYTITVTGTSGSTTTTGTVALTVQ